jgi:hypothetical protein
VVNLGKLFAGIGIAGMLGSGIGVAGAVPLSEGFDDISSLAGAGWVQTNNSAPLGSTGWFQGNDSVFPAASGPPTSYIAANFNNAAFGGAISNWLLTPELNMFNGEELSFSLRLLGEGFTDTVSVYYSTSGSSSDVGATPLSTGVFSLLASYSNFGPDTGWIDYTVTLSGLGAPANGRFAFRYIAGNTSVDANYIGIDNVSVPEPSTLAVFALGLAMLGWHLRRGNAG